MYRLKRIEKHLSKILYYDYRCFDKETETPEYYFEGLGGEKAEVIDSPTTIVEKKNTSIQGIADIQTDRPMVETDNNVLQLRNNRDVSEVDRANFKINNFIIQKEVGVITSEKPENKHNGLRIKTISVPDYDELSARELIKFDKRTTLVYFRDLLIIDHSIISIIFKTSLKDPLFIRVLQLVFILSMQFAVNAMLYTDGLIDKRATEQEDVYQYNNN
jgi:hypothetical protein